MAAPVRELAWVASLLGYCPDVDALTVRVEADSMPVGNRHETVIVLDVHARGWAEAEQLAQALRLDEGPGRTTVSPDGTEYQWRRWSGWIADGSQDFPVQATLTASERVSAGAVA